MKREKIPAPHNPDQHQEEIDYELEHEEEVIEKADREIGQPLEEELEKFVRQ